MAGSLEGRIALITGASRGIGQEIAKRYAAEGAHLILISRDVKGLEETDDLVRAEGGNATLIPFDLSEFDKIPELAKMIAERFTKIDILVGNAGMLGDMAPVADQNPENWHKVFDVNVHANFHLIRCFDPLLKASEAPRAMFVTSGITENINPYWGAYATSKYALDYMIKLYAAENEKTSLKVNLISPGQVRTRMHAQAFPGVDPETITPTEALNDVFVKLAKPDLQETGKVFHAQKG
ncbi:MAG: SDR family NAD(P)-dependent oxidoreductase [Rickettsiales bacterium]